MNQYSEASLKNIKFGNQIRNRNRQEYFRKLRNEFLHLQANTSLEHQLSLQNLMNLMEGKPTKKTLHSINTIIIKKREELSEQMFTKICQLITSQFLSEKQNENLVNCPLLNDYIALFSNILALPKFQEQINQNFNLEEIVEKVLDLICKVQFHTGELLLWLLYALCRAGNAKLTAIISTHQISLKEKFGLLHPNLVHLFCQLSFHPHSCIESRIIDEFLEQKIGRDTRKQFCFNIVDILEKNYQHRQSPETAAKILSWINLNLSNTHFPAEAKSEIITLLYVLVRERLEIEQLAWLLDSKITNEIIQRAQFDSSFYNKCISTFVLCELVRTSPILHLEILIIGYSQLIQIFTDALSLMQNDVILDCLRALTRIILAWPKRKDIWSMMQEAKLEREVEILANSPCHEISGLATSILEEYFQK